MFYQTVGFIHSVLLGNLKKLRKIGLHFRAEIFEPTTLNTVFSLSYLINMQLQCTEK